MKIVIKNILCPVDFSECSNHALDYAIAFAQAHDAELTLLHVTELPVSASLDFPVTPNLIEKISENGKKQVKAKEIQVAEQHSKVKSVHFTGNSFVEIIKYARESRADLLVLGTHGTKSLAHVLMGDVSEKVVRKAPCPVLTIKHPEHEFIMP
ncbi:universal stress protein [Myxococcota bacterium]|nr:universal stress protein [Myxococcota bacterium]MBU1535410.1 universal stress protein [Myxococcota bacterium]